MALLTMALSTYRGSTYYGRLQLAQLLLLVGEVLRQRSAVPLEETDELARGKESCVGGPWWRVVSGKW